MARREETLRQEQQRLQDEARLLQGAREALAEEQRKWEAERGERSAALDRDRTDAEAARIAAVQLHKQLPELEETRRRGAGASAADARAVREQLAEVSTYAAQVARIWSAAGKRPGRVGRVRRQELELHKARRAPPRRGGVPAAVD
jgi:hypothetical protein